MAAYNVDEIIANNIAQHGSAQNENLLAIAPVFQGYVDDGHDSTGPLFHIGYLSGEPVYRTTHTVAHRKDHFLIIKKSIDIVLFLRHGGVLAGCVPYSLATTVPWYLVAGVPAHAVRCHNQERGMDCVKDL